MLIYHNICQPDVIPAKSVYLDVTVEKGAIWINPFQYIYLAYLDVSGEECKVIGIILLVRTQNFPKI